MIVKFGIILEKANVVAGALSRKERNKPLHVRALMMTVHNDLPKQIREVQKEEMKRKNVRAENLGRLIKQIFEFRPDGTRCFGNRLDNRVWFPRFDGLRDLVKAEHQKLSGLLQQPKIPVWKWERITMNFVSGLPRTPSGYDTIWVIIDRLTKSSHFLPIKKTDSMEKLTQLYFEGSCFSLVGKVFLFRHFGEIAFYVKDLEIVRKLEVEFGYEYHFTTLNGMDKSKGLYKRLRLCCRACVIDFGCVRIAICQWVSPWKGVVHFGKREKLSPRYIRRFKILARVGPVAYTLELPEELKGIHSTFHVLNLKICLAEGDIVFPIDEIQLDDKLHMIEEPVEDADREVKRLKQSQIPIVKVR
ncbi:putative reverse transcriptase domain-containing protein [Tanacetum coccineum]|uniref:Reverse transcriptase domain-containing protein n=1 Tax=Tanacetum coccineum TaxID=301880 RepID=A0ABQ5A2N0_9ASTR